MRRELGSGGEFGAEGGGDGGLDEEVDLAAEASNFFDEARGDVGQLFAGHEEDGFEVGLEFAIHEGELKLELEVGDGAETANEGDGFLFAGEVDEETVEWHDADVGEVAGDGADEVDAFVEGEEALFVVFAGDADDDFVEEAGGAFEDIEVTVGDGVKTSGVDGSSHGGMIGEECKAEVAGWKGRNGCGMEGVLYDTP